MNHLKLLVYLRIFSWFSIALLALSGCAGKGEWEAQPLKTSDKVTISFMSEGTRTTVEMERNSKMSKPEDPKKDGSVFIGWFVGEGDDAKPFDFQNTEITGDLTLYAKFREMVTVTFSVKGATVSRVIEKGSKIPEPPSPALEAGESFLGWFYEPEAIYKFNFGKTSIDEDVTIYAVFTKNQTVKVTFMVDNSEFNSVTLEKGTKVELPTAPTKPGNKFVGWFVNLNSPTGIFDFNTPVNNDLVLYAKFEALKSNEAIVTFETLGGTPINPVTVTIGAKVSRPTQDPQKSTFVFSDWYADAGFKTLFDFNNMTIPGDTTLYAKFDSPPAPVSRGTIPSIPQFTVKLGTDPKTQIVLEWPGHTDFGKAADGSNAAPANPAYRVEISTDGVNYATPVSPVTLSKAVLVSTDKTVTVSGLSPNTNYWFRLSALNTNATGVNSASYVYPGSQRTDAAATLPVATSPASPQFAVRLGTDPKTQIVLAWPSHTDFGRMADGSNAAPANPAYIVEISTDGRNYAAPVMPVTLSKAALVSTDKSVTVSGLSPNTSYWFKLTALSMNTTGLNSTSYIYSNPQKTSSNTATTTPTPIPGADPAHIPDVIKSVEDVNTRLGTSPGQYFSTAWEAQKITGLTPLEQLITKQDYETLFPYAFQKSQVPGLHDQDHTYYTWENLVAASRYFPKFLNEGTKEDKYRELAAFLGNKSHETGEGWTAMGVDRYKMGLVWIVELAAFRRPPMVGGTMITSKEQLYEAYFPYYLDGFPPNVPSPGKSYHGRGPVQLSHPANYGQFSASMFNDRSLLLDNPDLIARDGVYGWASAIWFWMQPQSNKPSSHDVMIGNVDLSEPYTPPTAFGVGGTQRTYTANSKGHDVTGQEVSYQHLRVPHGLEVGFGMTINIINGGLEGNGGKFDGRQARRIAFYARFLDYFGTTKGGRDDGKNEPISPQVGGVGGDPVPQHAIDLFKQWKTWINLEPGGDFPFDQMPNVISNAYTQTLNI